MVAPAVREAMMLDAYDDLGRTRRKHEVPGRPRRPWSADQMQIMKMHWHDLRHITNEDAAKAVRKSGVPATTSIIGKLLGKSGRTSGPKARK